MLVEMSRAQVDAVLRAETNGRLSCDRGGRTYVVPVQYRYDGVDLVVQPPSGHCLRLDDDRVRFEVDHVQGVGCWQTVLAWGMSVATEPDGGPPTGVTAGPATLRIRISSLRGFVHQRRASDTISRLPA